MIIFVSSARRFDAMPFLKVLDDDLKNFKSILKGRNGFKHTFPIEIVPKELLEIKGLHMFLTLFGIHQRFIIQKMKYSIISEAVQQPIPIQLSGPINRTFSNYKETHIISVLQSKQLKLQHIKNASINQEGQEKKMTVKEFLVSYEEEIEWDKISAVWSGQGEWILVLQSPMRLYYVLQKYESIVPIKLDQTINIQTMQCFVNYPQVLIYGDEAQSFQNHVYSVNLTTFQIREIKSTKDYSPKGRKQPWSFFSDFRLYVTGGLNQKDQSIDSLMWTYNIDSGYWFALQFSAQGININSNAINCQYQNGKVIVVDKGSISLVELYQSRAREVEGWKDTLTLQELQSIQGIFVSEGWIYFQNGKCLLPKRFKIQKTKQTP